jgi:hypothetical protein
VTLNRRRKSAYRPFATYEILRWAGGVAGETGLKHF